MLALALTALNAAWFHELHVGADGEHALEAVGEFLLHGKHAAYVVGEEVAAHLNLHLQGVEVTHAVDDEHVLWLKLGQLQDDALHL